MDSYDFLVDSLDITKTKILKPKNENGVFLSRVVYSEGTEEDYRRYYLQFPKMKISVIGEEQLEVMFINKSNKYGKKVYSFLKELEEYIINEVHSHCKEWFGKDIPEKSIREMYNSPIEDSIKFFLKSKKLQVVNKKGESIQFEQLSVESECDFVAHIKHILFKKDTFTIEWEIDTIKSYKKIEKTKVYSFIEEEEENIPSTFF